MKTAMQVLKTTVEELEKACKEHILSCGDNAEKIGELESQSRLITLILLNINTLLPKEREQIERAYNWGYSDRSIGKDNQSLDYFKTTYND